jgi:hypothetical protein
MPVIIQPMEPKAIYALRPDLTASSPTSFSLFFNALLVII